MFPFPEQIPIGFQPGKPTVWGFRTQIEDSLVKDGDIQVFYVDSGATGASDDNPGTDPNYPLATIQELIDRALGTSTTTPALTNYDIVYVGGSVSEDVTTGDYDELPSYVQLIGAGTSRYSPAWIGDDANTTSLDLGCIGWRISGFRFYGKTGAPCIELHHTDVTGNDIAIRTVIDNCYFDGLTTGLAGIETHGCYDVWIVNNTFSLWNNAGNTAAGMVLNTSPLAIPYRNHIYGNKFYDNDNNAIWPCNGCLWYENIFQSVGYAYSAVQSLQTSVGGNPGDDNILYGNVFQGDFSIAGGYTFGTNDFPMGNFANDTAEAEVDTTGLVIAIPT